VEVKEEDDEVMYEMEKGPRVRLPSQTPAAKTKYRSRWMRRKQMNTMATQTTATEPEILAIKMESLNLEAIAKKREKEIQAEILSGTLWQERLKKQLEECSRNRRQASATATNVDGGTSCRGATASRRTADADNNNTDDWQAELLHDVDEDTFEKLDSIAADLDKMGTRERWLFCRSCKSWHTVPCSKTSSKFLMLSILGLLLQTRPINAADMQGKGDYSIADF
jgi:chromatin segregation and condensation protein Rec8/ScpA/Scc1 (kleisin family)